MNLFVLLHKKKHYICVDRRLFLEKKRKMKNVLRRRKIIEQQIENDFQFCEMSGKKFQKSISKAKLFYPHTTNRANNSVVFAKKGKVSPCCLRDYKSMQNSKRNCKYYFNIENDKLHKNFYPEQEGIFILRRNLLEVYKQSSPSTSRLIERICENFLLFA